MCRDSRVHRGVHRFLDDRLLSMHERRKEDPVGAGPTCLHAVRAVVLLHSVLVVAPVNRHKLRSTVLPCVSRFKPAQKTLVGPAILCCSSAPSLGATAQQGCRRHGLDMSYKQHRKTQVLGRHEMVIYWIRARSHMQMVILLGRTSTVPPVGPLCGS